MSNPSERIFLGKICITLSDSFNIPYNIKIFKKIEIFFRLPVPSVPPLSLVPHILVDSFVITMVAYTISMSMALIFAQKVGYEIDSNQELMAQVNLKIAIYFN